MEARPIRRFLFLTAFAVVAGNLAAAASPQAAPPFPGHRVFGAVTGAPARPGSTGSTMALYRGLECGRGSPDFTTVITSSGSYEIRDVPRGVFSACLPHADDTAGHFGPLSVVVAGADIRFDLHFEEGPHSTELAREARQPKRAGEKGFVSLLGDDAGKTIAGRVSMVAPETPPRGMAATAVVYLVPVDGRGAPMRPLVTLTTSLEPPSSGFFEIENVPPGQYNLFGTVPDNGSRLHDETGTVAIGRLPISIEGFELGTVSIVAQRGVAVAGRVTRNGLPLSGGVALMLEPAMDVAGIPPYQDVARFRPVVAPDGTFVFTQVPEGHYRLRAAIVGAPATPIRILQAEKDITEGGLQISGTPPPPIEIAVGN
jgi:hypothetical protein